MSEERTILAFDFGERRIGVAVGQTVSRTARALETLKVRNGRPDWTAVSRLIDSWTPNLLLVGLPRHADGTRHRLAPAIERYCRRLRGRFKVPLQFVDERLSSIEADHRGAQDRDAVAAQVILETWLNDPLRDARLNSSEDTKHD